MRTEPKAKEHNKGGTVFQTAVPPCSTNPETSSRVTLAALGIGFQPKLVATDTVIYYIKPITINLFFLYFLSIDILFLG